MPKVKMSELKMSNGKNVRGTQKILKSNRSENYICF